MYHYAYVFSRVLVIGTLGFVSTLFFPESFAFAQGGIGIKISPSLVEERVDPGQVLEGSLTVTNENGGTQTFYVQTRDIIDMRESGAPIFADEDDTEKRTAGWIEPLVQSFTLAVGESTQLPYRITVPETAEPGSHSAAIFVTREADPVAESGAGVGFHVASLISLRVSGEVTDDLQLRSFSTLRAFHTTPAVTFEARLENNGNVTQRPQGIISISNMFGKEVGKVDMNDTAGAILPHTERLYTVDWQPDGFMFGRYTAMLSVVYGDLVRKTITRELSVWIVPVKEVGIVLGGVVLLLGALLLALRAYVRKELKRAGHTSTPRSRAEMTLAQRMSRTVMWIILMIVIGFVGLVVFFQ